MMTPDEMISEVLSRINEPRLTITYINGAYEVMYVDNVEFQTHRYYRTFTDEPPPLTVDMLVSLSRKLSVDHRIWIARMIEVNIMRYVTRIPRVIPPTHIVGNRLKKVV